MIVTLPILADRFNRYNALIFGGKLPRIPLRISSAATRAGSFSHRIERTPSGPVHRRTITISRAFDLEPDRLDDVIIHEMIHYWIDLYGPHEAPHGPAFRAMMEEINRVHGRHITVTVAKRPEKKRPFHIVCVATLSDGRTGIAIPARTRIQAMCRDIPRLFPVSGCRWYIASDSFFDRFPAALKPKLYLQDPDILAKALADAREIEIDITSGRITTCTTR